MRYATKMRPASVLLGPGGAHHLGHQGVWQQQHSLVNLASIKPGSVMMRPESLSSIFSEQVVNRACERFPRVS